MHQNRKRKVPLGHGLLSYIKTIAELAKVKITIAVSFTTITGFILYKEGWSAQILLPTLGIFLLACGSSVINHLQEYRTDSKMERTKNRPIPSGRISLLHAWGVAGVFVLAGSVILWFTSTLEGFALGLLALIWYNLVYTNLKRKTYYAVIPGSVIGAIPPLVGWVSAGGPLLDYRALAIAIFFFVWQVPHFWLLMLKYGKEYQKAGFPSITDKSERVIKSMTFIWTITTTIAALLLPFYNVVHSRITTFGIVLASAWLIFKFLQLLNNKNGVFSPGRFFMRINYYVLAMIILLITDHLYPW
jgi:heme o synthase